MRGIIKPRRTSAAAGMHGEADMTIAAIIDKQGSVITVAADARVADVIALLADKRIGAVPVMRDDEVAGILSERDILYRLASDGAAILEKTAVEIMTSPAITATRDLPIMSALGLMTKRRIRHLPVIDAGRLVGFVSIGDLVKIRIDRIEGEAMAMRDYIQGV
jgi:CBS domain-containing protein